ncbi:LysR family transcriptional regulator [Aquamicrobium zhengzhouense]|uniref:LysR family transcriptional regulator n=1 Tax=Aquamicrobium zhengzhouense TaxID=2781738 RepID=A0ABS0SAX8_9HYPH|nr:LysR family transcriptional regulator [Aquamicrobium zhengzhouense]MBI1619810.1 LysR family transcriptional regulator [Aquamicrobium zhengzhouense]
MIAYPNLRHIRLFAFAVETGSLSKAAEAVRVSQPAASQAISRLEEHFSGDLFERRGSGVFLTERGKVVSVRATRIIELLRSANVKLAKQSRIGRGLAQDLLETHATIAHLRALAGFARVGSFSAAARMLGQAEPSVQRAARELERIGGVPLFDGRQQSVRLTTAGQMIASIAGLVLRELESAVEEVRELDGSFDGRVVVGTLPLVRTSIIPDAIARCAAQRPGASFEILDGSYEALLHSLMIGDLDLLVGALRDDKVKRGITQEALFVDGLSIVARADHPLFRLENISYQDLVGYPWALPRRSTPTRVIFDAIAAEHGFGPRDGEGIVETGSLVALRGILVQSDRLTILSRHQIRYEEEAGLLRVLPVELPATERPIGIASRTGWKPTALQAEFLAALRDVSSA